MRTLIGLITFTMLLIGCNVFARAQVSEEEPREQLQVDSQAPVNPPTLDLLEAAQGIVDQTNDFRDQQHRQPVQVQPQLQQTAQYFANYMAGSDTYGHTADGKRPSQRAKQHDYEYCIVAENIAYAYRSDGFTERALADKFVQGWIASAEHRANMVDPDMTEIGVAIARSDKSGVYYAVQMFGRPRSAAVQFSITNRAGEEIEYVLAGREFTLPPHYTRTHQQCRPSQLDVVIRPEDETQQSPAATFHPEAGDQFVVTRQNDRLSVAREDK